MHTRQHSRRQTTTRLLLLAAATTAGIGISLAFDSAAHAADHDEPGPLDAAGRFVAHTVDRADDTPTAESKTAAPALKAAKRHVSPARVRAVVERTATVRLARTVRDTADQVTAALPVIGRIVDTAPATLAPPPLPDLGAAVDLTIPAAGGRTAGSSTPTAQQAAPKTAPEPTGEQPPLITVGSGAPTAAIQHPAVGARHATESRPDPVGRQRLTAAVDGRGQQPGPHQLDGCHGDHAATAPTVQVPLSTPAERWTHTPRWQEAVIGHIYNHSGRIPPPSPPSG